MEYHVEDHSDPQRDGRRQKLDFSTWPWPQTSSTSDRIEGKSRPCEYLLDLCRCVASTFWQWKCGQNDEFDASRSISPDIASKNLANPTAIFDVLFLMLLYQLGETSVGQGLRTTMLNLLCQKIRSRDVGETEFAETFTPTVAIEISNRFATQLSVQF